MGLIPTGEHPLGQVLHLQGAEHKAGGEAGKQVRNSRWASCSARARRRGVAPQISSKALFGNTYKELLKSVRIDRQPNLTWAKGANGFHRRRAQQGEDTGTPERSGNAGQRGTPFYPLRHGHFHSLTAPTDRTFVLLWHTH